MLWVWHLEDAQLNGQTHIRETLPETERERLFRSLNASLRIVRENDRRGILVEWSREGPSGMVVWDELGHWKGVPERIEAVLYGSGGGTSRRLRSRWRRSPRLPSRRRVQRVRRRRMC